MKIKLIRGCQVQGHGRCGAGDELEVDDAYGEQLIGGGFAEVGAVAKPKRKATKSKAKKEG